MTVKGNEAVLLILEREDRSIAFYLEISCQKERADNCILICVLSTLRLAL